MVENRKKLSSVILLNVIFCLFVVFVHISSNPINVLDKQSILYTLVFIPWKIAGVACYAFIFLSAFKLFYSHKDSFDYKKIYLSRLLKILLPYIVFTLIYYFYFLSRNYYSFDFLDLLKYIFDGTLVAPFYYIIILVQFYLLLPVWKIIIKKTNPIITIVVSLIVTIIFSLYLPNILSSIFNNYSFPYNDRLLTSYLFYWIIGCYAGYYYEYFCEIIEKRKISIIAIFSISTLLHLILSYFTYTQEIYFPYSPFILHLFIIFSILASFVIVKKYTDNKEKFGAIISILNESTYYIFLIHCLIISIIDEILTNINLTNVYITYPIRLIIVFSTSILLCCGYSILKNIIKSKIANKNQNK